MSSFETINAAKIRGASRARGEETLPKETWVKTYRGVLKDPNADAEEKAEALAGIAAYKAITHSNKISRRWAKRNGETIARILVTEAIVFPKE